MTDEKLDTLLAGTFNQEVKVPVSMFYKARAKAKNKAQQQERIKEYYPFLLILLMHMAVVLTCGTGFILLAQSLKMVVGIILAMFALINLPIGAYILVMIYYKDQETYKNLQEEI